MKLKLKKSQLKTILFWIIVAVIFLLLMLFIFGRANTEGNKSLDVISNSLF
ncbi:MAG: hypothetical protein QXS41_03895 [Candidatus Woesearchaeota archaeon]